MQCDYNYNHDYDYDCVICLDNIKYCDQIIPSCECGAKIRYHIKCYEQYKSYGFQCCICKNKITNIVRTGRIFYIGYDYWFDYGRLFDDIADFIFIMNKTIAYINNN